MFTFDHKSRSHRNWIEVVTSKPQESQGNIEQIDQVNEQESNERSTDGYLQDRVLRGVFHRRVSAASFGGKGPQIGLEHRHEGHLLLGTRILR